MDSIKNYVEAEYQKDLINQLLNMGFKNIKKEDYEKLTELIATKIKLQNNMRTEVKKQNFEAIHDTAAEYGITEDEVLDSFMYFYLTVENSLLLDELSHYKSISEG